MPVLQERFKGFAEVKGPDAVRINAAHAAKSERAREQKLPELLIAVLQRGVREITSSQVAFQSSVEAQLETRLAAGTSSQSLGRLTGE